MSKMFIGTVREKQKHNLKAIPLTNLVKRIWSTKIFPLKEDPVKGIEGKLAIQKVQD